MKRIFSPNLGRQLWAAARVVLLTYLAVYAQSGGYLTRLDHVLYDQRAALCQRHMPAPTPDLVHLDIDDLALTQVGRWPWHRDVLARMLDEIRLTEPKVLAMDILFAETEEPGLDDKGKPIDRDGMLTDVIARFGRVLVPASFTFDPPPPREMLPQRLADLLSADLELTHDQCVKRLRESGMHDANLSENVTRAILIVRPEVIYERIHHELATPIDALVSVHAAEGATLSKEQVKRRLFPHADQRNVATVLDRLFDEEYERVVRERALRRFALRSSTGTTPVVRGYDQTTPILPLSNAARYSAFVNYLPDLSEGAVRRVPLLARYRGTLVPQMGLAIACAMLDVDIHNVRLGDNSITIPCRDGREVVIPTSTIDQSGIGPVGYLMEVPMFGKRGSWQTMYDFPRHEKVVQHLSMYEVWLVCLTQRRIASNEAAADRILFDALTLTNPVTAQAYRDHPLTGEARQALIDQTLAVMDEMRKGLAGETNPDDDEKKLLASLELCNGNLCEIRTQNQALQKQLIDFRAELRSRLHGKAVLLGGTATGHVDQFPTSLHPQCPGVVIHGAVVNAILTGRLWRVAPRWVTLLITGAIALLTGILTSNLSPAKGFVAAAMLCSGYLAINGYLLFDHFGVIIGAAGPAFGVGLVWTTITCFEFITEASERARITRRFSTYVDPSLVNYVIQHREKARFDGEAREMTMGFTDLADFTTLTESLGPKTVQLLSEYMNSMIPAIRANRGYVSRLMGDGIYFFFGAPEPDENHALHAVSTVLAMHKAVDELNATLPQRGFPLLRMRAGLCTGPVIVGDAGSNTFHDYTAVGDSVNTAARLESANKFLGTKALVSARTIALLNGKYLSRPIGNLRVAGKKKGLVVYEPLCRSDEATPRDEQLLDLSVQVVSTYQCANFTGCIEAVDRMETWFGPSKFAALYRRHAIEYEREIPEDFDGQVIFSEK